MRTNIFIAGGLPLSGLRLCLLLGRPGGDTARAGRGRP